MLKKLLPLLLTVSLILSLAGCSGNPAENTPDDTTSPNTSSPTEISDSGETATELELRFGDSEPFTIHLYDNPTAAIAGYVGTAFWQLPIYHYDDYTNWEVMQYYDLPSRYEIPFAPESITSEAAGTVYYSGPNRIVLF